MALERPDKLLTPAAREALDAYLNDFREQIMMRAARQAASFGGQPEVSVRDILTALTAERTFPLSARRRRLNLLLRLYVRLGAILSVFGVAVLAAPQFAVLDPQERIGLLISLGGLLLAVMAWLMSAVVQDRAETDVRNAEAFYRTSGATSEGEFLVEWAHLEGDLRELIAQRFGESRATGPLTALLEVARDHELLSLGEMEHLRKLLSVRNDLAHNRGAREGFELDSALESLRQVRRRLEHLSRP